jgi:hypothetical protein
MAAVRKLRLASSLMVITIKSGLARREGGGGPLQITEGPEGGLGPTTLNMFLTFS